MMLGELERVTEGRGGGGKSKSRGVGFAHTGGAGASHWLLLPGGLVTLR